MSAEDLFKKHLIKNFYASDAEDIEKVASAIDSMDEDDLKVLSKLIENKELEKYIEEEADKKDKLARKKGWKIKEEPERFRGGRAEPAAKAPPGKGARFRALVRKIMKRRGFKPRIKGQTKEEAAAAIAAAIGRAKFGKRRFQQMAAAGKRKKSELRLILDKIREIKSKRQS